MIALSLLEWLRTGDLGPLRLGMTRQQIEALLGPPDDVGGTSCRHRVPLIWRYGDIEVHFGRRDDPMWLILLDHLTVPTGGPRLALDPWIVRGGLPRVTVGWHASAQDRLSARSLARQRHRSGARLGCDDRVCR